MPRATDGRDVERELCRDIVTLWQTALIRLSRLKIQDEIETGLRYYPAAFFDVIPQVNAEVRTALQARWPDAHLLDEPILRPGSWIGGAIATGTPMSPPRWCAWLSGQASYTALGHYFVEITALERRMAGAGQRSQLVVHLDEPRRHRQFLAHGSVVLADDRLARPREAVRVFGFHLSGLDMRQNSDVRELEEVVTGATGLGRCAS